VLVLLLELLRLRWLGESLPEPLRVPSALPLLDGPAVEVGFGLLLIVCPIGEDDGARVILEVPDIDSEAEPLVNSAPLADALLDGTDVGMRLAVSDAVTVGEGERASELVAVSVALVVVL
jgi:hypothetical protein